MQSVEAQYQELVQAEDVKTARTRTGVAYTALMAPVVRYFYHLWILLTTL